MPEPKPRRRPMRLTDFDYTSEGGYFVTIVVQDRRLLFGQVVDGVSLLNAQGEMVRAWWDRLPSKFPEVQTGAFVVMPNHVHGVGFITGDGAATRGRPYDEPADPPVRPTLGRIVGWFKTMTTNAYLRGVRDGDWPPVERRLWQRNYYDHIVRNAEELSKIERYVAENPEHWPEDEDNPGAIRP